jgi:alkylation response protein AidB-like acyl-CoA dehydrogenase
MDLTFSASEEAFRAELRAWLDAHVPQPREYDSLADEVRHLVAWQHEMAAGGWVGVHWPRQYGGRGATSFLFFLIQEVLDLEHAP